MAPSKDCRQDSHIKQTHHDDTRQQQQPQQQPHQQQQQQQQQQDAEAARRAALFMNANTSSPSFDAVTLSGIRLVGAQRGRVVAAGRVTPELQNRYGTLHGGAIATLVDVVGSAALVTQSNRGGVSLAINTLYLNPMPGGEEVEVEARVIKQGRDVATIEVQLRRRSNGQLVAQGTHVKKLVSTSDLSALFEAGPQQQQQQQPRSKL